MQCVENDEEQFIKDMNDRSNQFSLKDAHEQARMDAVRAANARILADAREPKDLVVAIEFRVARIFSDTAKTYSAQESSRDSPSRAPHTTIQTDRKHPSFITYVGSCQGIELSDLVRAYVVAGIRIRLGHYQGIVPYPDPKDDRHVDFLGGSDKVPFVWHRRELGEKERAYLLEKLVSTWGTPLHTYRDIDLHELFGFSLVIQS